jgi:hypothetical protein
MRNGISKQAVMWLICLFSVIGHAISYADENSPPAYVPDAKKESAWLFGLNRTYDEWFVDQKSVHVQDPYTWVYTEAFAKDFGMPDRWIDKGLTGADALAFRTGTAFPLCGWNGKKDACHASPTCILEMYFNRKSNPLPWGEKIRWTDLQFNQTSVWTLGSLRAVNRVESVNIGPKSPLSDPESGEELFWWYEWESREKSGGVGRIMSYDRSVFENYSLIIINIGCERDEYAGLNLRPNPRAGISKRSLLSIKFPKSWRDRIRSTMTDIRERQGAFFKQKFEELKSSSN